MAQGQASLENLSGNEVCNILKRLTVKNLCQMRKLSSTWKGLINDSNLINLHRAWSKKNPLLLVVTQPVTSKDHLLLTSVNPTDGAVVYQVRIETCDDKADLRVLSSGSGCLFCILRWSDSVIFNATTKEIQTIPNVDPPPSCDDHFVIGTGCGYIESRHVYAIIKLFSKASSCQILMLSETGEVVTTWRTTEQKYPECVFPDKKGVMVRNQCFWLNREIVLAKWCQSKVSPANMNMLCLDLESEMFSAIRYPNIGKYEGTEMHLGDLKDELFLGYSHGDPLVMDIWVLKDLQKSDWNMEYRVDLSLIGGIDDLILLSKVKLIGYVEGEQGGGVLMFRDSQRQVLLYYNVEERRFKEGKRIQVENNVLDMFPYSESFASIKRPAI